MLDKLNERMDTLAKISLAIAVIVISVAATLVIVLGSVWMVYDMWSW